MSNKEFDYRVIGLKCHMGFDYVEDEIFEEFFLKLNALCDDYNVHLSTIIRRTDLMLCEVKK